VTGIEGAFAAVATVAVATVAVLLVELVGPPPLPNPLPALLGLLGTAAASVWAFERAGRMARHVTQSHSHRKITGGNR
jgi:hypothetical protein